MNTMHSSEERGRREKIEEDERSEWKMREEKGRWEKREEDMFTFNLSDNKVITFIHHVSSSFFSSSSVFFLFCFPKAVCSSIVGMMGSRSLFWWVGPWWATYWSQLLYEMAPPKNGKFLANPVFSQFLSWNTPFLSTRQIKRCISQPSSYYSLPLL